MATGAASCSACTCGRSIAPRVPAQPARAGLAQRAPHRRPSLQLARSTEAELISSIAAASSGETGEVLQSLIVGGAVMGAVGAALVGGLKKEEEVCDLCQGTGGTKCFGCSGVGKMTALSREDIEEIRRRDAFARTRNPQECRVCRGVGLILCSKCNGRGYVQAL